MSGPTKPELTAKTPDDQVTWGGWPINRETAQAIGCPPGLSGIALPITSVQIDAGQISYRHPRAEDIGEAIRRAISGPPALQINTAVSIGPGHSIISDAELERLKDREQAGTLAADEGRRLNMAMHHVRVKLASLIDFCPYMQVEDLLKYLREAQDVATKAIESARLWNLPERPAQATTDAAGKDGQK